MGTTQLLSHDAYGVTFADPTKPDYSVRFKTTKNKKSLNGVSVDNYLNEIIINDTNEITIGTATANDALSIRTRISGSVESQARVRAIAKQLGTQLVIWADEHVFTGFEPGTVPVNPA